MTTTGSIQVTSGTIEMGGAWTNEVAVTAANGTTLDLGDNWDDWGFPTAGGLYAYGYHYLGINDVWVNNGTITTESANVYLGGWLSMIAERGTSPRSI